MAESKLSNESDKDPAVKNVFRVMTAEDEAPLIVNAAVPKASCVSAVLVVKAFQSEAAKNQDYWIQGLEALDTNEAAEKFVGSYPKRKLKIQSAPLGVLKVVSYFSDPKMKYMVKIMDSVLHMPEPFKGEKAWNDLGKPTTTIEKFAANS